MVQAQRFVASAFGGLLVSPAFFPGHIGLADAQQAAMYPNDLYHCNDPTNEENKLACDFGTHRWDLDALDPKAPPDDSGLCSELVDILVRAKEQEQAAAGQLSSQQQTLQADILVWETIMETSVVDSLEPCVLWAMTYGRLMRWGFPSPPPGKQHQEVQVQDSENPDPSDVSVAFDTILLTLVWDRGLADPLLYDSTQLHQLTGQHMLDSLKAELGPSEGPSVVEFLDLRVTAGLPDYDTRSLPLTLTGRVVFRDSRQALGPSSLRRVLLHSAFEDPEAMDLYLFRLRIASDPTLNEVDTVLAGREALTEFILQQGKIDTDTDPSRYELDPKKPVIDTSEMDLSEEDEGFVSNLLIAIISAVVAAIVAVCCFAYCLICRSRTSGQAFKTLEEHSLVDEEVLPPSAFEKKLQSHADDGVPAVRTASTKEMADDNEEYDIEYVTGSQVDDGVSDYEMDTLPPPSTYLPDTDDERSVLMSVMDGYDEEIAAETFTDEDHEDHNYEEDTQSVGSDANTSLYSYIPDDTSLTASLVNPSGPLYKSRSNTGGTFGSEKGKDSKPQTPETTAQTAQNKSLLWSVMDSLDKSPTADTDSDKAEVYIEHSSRKPRIASPRRPKITSPSTMLGPSPSDDDSRSHDSDSLLYGTEDDQESGRVAAAVPHGHSEAEQEQPPQSQPAAPNAQKKEEFEELWKDEDEADEAESVIGFFSLVQSARRSSEAPTDGSRAGADENENAVDTPRGDDAETNAKPTAYGASDEALVDRVPEKEEEESQDTEGEKDPKLSLPLPTPLESTLQEETKPTTAVPTISRSADDCSVSGSSVSSTDSSKFRSLLGQSDTNDAALLFGRQQKDDTPDAEVSMSSCTSNQLKSLLTRKGESDSSDEEADDFLFKETAVPETKTTRRIVVQEEEKKEGDFGDNDEDQEHSNRMYLPAAIRPNASSTPRGARSPEMHNNDDDATVYSVLSEAPSVDESIGSEMGWF
ncbi:unnamed protein product [Pseudo-nitzschia multistriata]|uniref:Uncharacterized protein n=1 Tax=Pseudo-nitzschia multistriata TaxID=183589 RepID=A0A448Z069_9STRA|nr:unnamed protein product [Pseudo-nitzschia multistriata]